MRRHLQPSNGLGIDKREPGRIEHRCILRGMGLAPQGVKLCHAGQVREFRRRLEVAQKVGETLSVGQHAPVARRFDGHMHCSGGPEPIAANQPHHRGEIRFECINAPLHHGVAVDREGRLLHQLPQARVHPLSGREKCIGEGRLELCMRRVHAATSMVARCSSAAAWSHSSISSPKAGRFPSRSISVGRDPARSMKRR
ncbi:hypothetical protein D3C85_598290 [compost metagenome]